MTTYQEIKQKHSDNVNKIMNDAGVFWAFSDSQFAEGLAKLKESGQLLEGEKLARLAGGGFVPSKNGDKMMQLLKESDATKKRELKEAKEAKHDAILYELKNCECFYTGEIDDVVELFNGIYSRADIIKVYHAHRGDDAIN